MSSSFGRAAASELSAATTAFVAASRGGGASGSAAAARQPDAAAQTSPAGCEDSAPARHKQNHFQASLPYHTSPKSSVVSEWRHEMWREVGIGNALARGLRGQDVRYGTACTPGVCVLKQQDDVPKVPGINSSATAEKQMIINSVTKQLLQLGVVLTEPPHGPHGAPREVAVASHGGQAAASKEASERRPKAPVQSPPPRSLGRRTASEASLGSRSGVSGVTGVQRRTNLPAVVARSRYQTFVVNKPKKDHRYCDPEPCGTEVTS